MASTSSSPAKSQPQSYLDLPDDSPNQRGRKRRRSSGNSPPMHTSSTGSATLRGRVRHRSRRDSDPFSQSESETASKSPSRPSRNASPRRNLLKKAATQYSEHKEKKRRSQSPSRSRSVAASGGGKESPRPRRRRTRTHSRSHVEERGADAGRGESVEGTMKKGVDKIPGVERIAT